MANILSKISSLIVDVFMSFVFVLTVLVLYFSWRRFQIDAETMAHDGH